jgi:acyl-CoA synthetase (AMP-forming)/AMP-acid ligase II
VGQLVRAAADSFQDAGAVVLGEDRLTYSELDRRSRRLARGLLALGVTKGTRIGFVYGNSPDWVVTFAAISRIGAIAVPLSTFYRGPELARVLRHGDIAGLILVRSHLGHDYLDTLADGLPGLAGAGSPELALAEAPFLRWIVSLLPTLVRGGWVRCQERTATIFALETVPNEQERQTLNAGTEARGIPHWALGMTETLGPYAWGDGGRAERYPLCPPLDHLQPGFALRLVDEEGHEVPDGMPGEIVVRGPTVTR